jgi:malate-CoA ligase subunit beta
LPPAPPPLLPNKPKIEEEEKMDIHEHQAKDILRRFGVPVPTGGLAFAPEQAVHEARKLGFPVVVKAQVHAGGRGAAGGVKLCKTEAEVNQFALGLLGRNLVTKQTDANGKPIHRLWVETATNIGQELYLGLVLDRKSERIMIVASREGGIEIEDLAESNPNALVRMVIDPAFGFQDYQARELAFKLGMTGAQIGQMRTVLRGCYRAFRDLDATMVEINPLVITGAGDLIALDAKMSFDTNALFRRPEVAALRDPGQEDPREDAAAEHGLSYVGLEGDIGCLINGAGLAMATMDMIQLAGGQPANFLDIGGGASPERVVAAFRTVLTDPNVSVILVNIFAGINRCDWVAKGVVQAYSELGLTLPVVVRLAGTNVEEGRKIINDSGLPLISADTLAEAAATAVAARPRKAA